MSLNDEREKLFKAYGSRIPTSFKMLIREQDAEAVKELHLEVKEWICSKGSRVPINYGDIINKIFGGKLI